MSTWLARARREILKTEPPPTAKTDESPLSPVSSVPPGPVSENHHAVSSVSSVGVVAIFENHDLASELLAAAMHVCELFGDTEAAREQMRADCLALPPHLQADLRAHFRKAYQDKDLS